MDATRIVMNQIVMPAECDGLGICFGGQVGVPRCPVGGMQLIEGVGQISMLRHETEDLFERMRRISMMLLNQNRQSTHSIPVLFYGTQPTPA